jgi:DnaJ-class molecular chaperone
MEEKLKAALVVLGFVESATVEKMPKLKVITKMYHKLAMLHHPDRNPGCDEAIFKEITEAYRLAGRK